MTIEHRYAPTFEQCVVGLHVSEEKTSVFPTSPSALESIPNNELEESILNEVEEDSLYEYGNRVVDTTGSVITVGTVVTKDTNVQKFVPFKKTHN